MHAEKWLVRLFKRLPLSKNAVTLSRHTRSGRAWLTARHLLFGRGHGVYRIIFDIQEDRRHVRVLRVWHSFRDAITVADVEE